MELIKKGNWNYVAQSCIDCQSYKEIRIDAYNKLQGNPYRCVTCTSSAHLKRVSTTHGMYNTPAYRSWQKMKDRTGNPNHRYYRLYKDIPVASSWATFEAFYADMGDCPEGWSLDRIDNNLGYNKDNCRWIPKNDQPKNRRVCKKDYTPPTEIEYQQALQQSCKAW